jgi:hypothetical protein
MAKNKNKKPKPSPKKASHPNRTKGSGQGAKGQENGGRGGHGGGGNGGRGGFRGGGSSGPNTRGGPPLSVLDRGFGRSLFHEERPLLRPIKFVRSIETATLFQETEELLELTARNPGKRTPSFVQFLS